MQNRKSGGFNAPRRRVDAGSEWRSALNSPAIQKTRSLVVADNLVAKPRKVRSRVLLTTEKIGGNCERKITRQRLSGTGCRSQEGVAPLSLKTTSRSSEKRGRFTKNLGRPKKSITS